MEGRDTIKSSWHICVWATHVLQWQLSNVYGPSDRWESPTRPNKLGVFTTIQYHPLVSFRLLLWLRHGHWLRASASCVSCFDCDIFADSVLRQRDNKFDWPKRELSPTLDVSAYHWTICSSAILSAILPTILPAIQRMICYYFTTLYYEIILLKRPTETR